MDGKLSLFGAIGRKMAWLTQRQSVVAENIANADSPGYAPRDMKESAFARLLMRGPAPVTPTATDRAHLPGTLGGRGGFKDEEQRRPYETAPDGNAVVIEEQLIKVAETQMDYQLMTNLYRKHLSMIRTALGRGT
ncbi:MAG: flagellar basal body rod protein FlgB [Kiloniellales bacterium]